MDSSLPYDSLTYCMQVLTTNTHSNNMNYTPVPNKTLNPPHASLMQTHKTK